MDDKRWIELAKRRKQDKYFGIISLLIALMMVFFTLKNIGWLLTFIVVAVILYYWIDVEQKIVRQLIGRRRLFLLSLE